MNNCPLLNVLQLGLSCWSTGNSIWVLEGLSQQVWDRVENLLQR